MYGGWLPRGKGVSVDAGMISGAAIRMSDTSSTLKTTGSLRGSVRNCLYRFISSRPQVMPKRNRSATMRVLKVEGVTPVSDMWR
jgi:hypothetical protein